GGDGEHSQSPRTRTRKSDSRFGCKQGSTDSAAAGHALHSRGVCSFVLHDRSLALALCAAFIGGRFCDGRLLFVVEFSCARAVNVDSAPACTGSGGCGFRAPPSAEHARPHSEPAHGTTGTYGLGVRSRFHFGGCPARPVSR